MPVVPKTKSRVVTLSAYLIIATAIVGYFVGIQSPMNHLEKQQASQARLLASRVAPRIKTSDLATYTTNRNVASANGSVSNGNHDFVVRAASYSEMASVVALRSQPSSISQIVSLSNEQDRFAVDPLILKQAALATSADVSISPEQKQEALQQRKKNRAYNGAPPTVTHPIDQMTAEACIACHAIGAKTANFRIPKMSHGFYTNCTQCHVASERKEFPSELFRENSFVGLPAPDGGPRAYPGAPPQMPHATWMRSECLSCHGPSSLRGIQSTHPWRSNCLQCHTPSSTLEQTQLESEPQFVEAIPFGQ